MRSCEDEVRARLSAGDGPGAASTLLRALGPEVAGYLCAASRDGEAAREAYARTQEAVLRSLPGWDGRASLRTWLYVVARSHLARVRRDEARRALRWTPIEHHPEAWEMAAPRPSTRPSTSRLDEVARLRAMLGPEDREMLVLRVERDLSWDEIARIVLGEGATSEQLARESARLRKRFSALRDRIQRARRAPGSAA